MDRLTAAQARVLIGEILDRLPNAQLPEPRMDGDTAWFGGMGFCIGSGTTNGKPAPTAHRRSGMHDLFCREMADRLETEFWQSKSEAS